MARHGRTRSHAYAGELPEVTVSIGDDTAKALIDTGHEGEWVTDADTWSILSHPGVRQTSVVTLGMGGLDREGLAIVPSASAPSP